MSRKINELSGCVFCVHLNISHFRRAIHPQREVDVAAPFPLFTLPHIPLFSLDYWKLFLGTGCACWYRIFRVSMENLKILHHTTCCSLFCCFALAVCVKDFEGAFTMVFLSVLCLDYVGTGSTLCLSRVRLKSADIISRLETAKFPCPICATPRLKLTLAAFSVRRSLLNVKNLSEEWLVSVNFRDFFAKVPLGCYVNIVLLSHEVLRFCWTRRISAQSPKSSLWNHFAYPVNWAKELPAKSVAWSTHSSIA